MQSNEMLTADGTYKRIDVQGVPEGMCQTSGECSLC